MAKSNADRQKEYRQRNAQTVTDRNVTRVTDSNVTPQDGKYLGTDGVTEYTVITQARNRRTNPDVLNWGQHMTSDQLHDAGLKANRVPIPGDWDYQGVAQC